MVPVFDSNIYFRGQTLVLMMKMIALLPSTVIKKHFTFKVCLLIAVRLCMIWTVEWCEIIVKLGKPWTPEIFLECYCGARKKSIRAEITKLQVRTLIRLWFCGLLACPDLCCDWLYSQLSLNGHLYKTDTSLKRTPWVGPCLSLLPLFDSL